jgi:hypothetical protein
MKRAKKTVNKRTYSLKGAIPMFVSLVDRGANFTPLSGLRYEDKETFGQDIEINRIVFSKSVFGTMDAVSNYLKENNYEEFSVSEDGETFLVGNIESDKFEDVQEIEYEDGVKFFIGKLVAADGEEQPAAEIVDSVEHNEEFSQETEEVEEVASVEASEELVQESQEDETNEEAKSEDTDTSSEESQEGFSAESEAQGEQEEIEEVVSTEINSPAMKFSDHFVTLEKYNALLEQISEIQEKLAKFEEKKEETIDEPEVLIQNSQSVQPDEIIKDESTQVDEAAERFSQKRKQDLFGLRGN